MIDFLILYEVKTREYESILILGSLLRCRGYTVEYLSFSEISRVDYLRYRRKLRYLRNNVKVLLVPSCYHNNELAELYYAAVGRTEKVVNLRWEQYFRNSIMDDPSTGSYLYATDSAKEAFHVCWGKYSYENMIAAGIPKDRLIETGPIHMDILRGEFASYFLNKKELLDKYGLDSNKQTILFISSFANATDRTSYFKYLDSFFDGKYVVNHEAIKREQRSYLLSLEWFDELLKKYPNINFIYRPHPSETITSDLMNLVHKHPSFKVITDYSVKQWILACDTLVTWVSTSIIEAFFANKSCYIIRPEEFPYEDDMCVYRGAKFISEKEEFLNILNQDSTNTLNEDLVYYSYDVKKDNPSYVRLANQLEVIINDKSESFPWEKEVIPLFRKRRFGMAFNSAKNYIKILIVRCAAWSMVVIKKLFRVSFGEKYDKKLSGFINKRQAAKQQSLTGEKLLEHIVQEEYKKMISIQEGI